MIITKSHLCSLCTFVLSGLLLQASTLDQTAIKSIFMEESGLPIEKIAEARFEDFIFDIGINKSATIIKSSGGGRTSVQWDDGAKSLLSIKVFAQKRYDKYTQELDVPMEIINGIPSESSKAALRDNGLRQSWRVGEMKGIGVYCVGQIRAGLGENVVSTGFFFDDEYGFCLQLSSLKDSGIELDSIENIGRELTEKMILQAKSEGLVSNPLSKAGSFAISKSQSIREGKRPRITDEVPSALPKSKSLVDSLSSGKYLGNGLVITVIAFGLLLAIILSSRKLFRK